MPLLLGKVKISKTFIRYLKQLLFNLTKEYFQVWVACWQNPGWLRWERWLITKKCLKYHLSLMRLQKSLKSLRNSGSFNFFCIDAKSGPFSRTFISVSVRTFLLRWKTISDTKLSDNLHYSVRTDGMLIWDWLLTGFRGHWGSSGMLRISLS